MGLSVWIISISIRIQSHALILLAFTGTASKFDTVVFLSFLLQVHPLLPLFFLFASTHLENVWF